MGILHPAFKSERISCINRQLQKASEINKIWIPEKSGFGLICLRERA